MWCNPRVCGAIRNAAIFGWASSTLTGPAHSILSCRMEFLLFGHVERKKIPEMRFHILDAVRFLLRLLAEFRALADKADNGFGGRASISRDIGQASTRPDPVRWSAGRRRVLRPQPCKKFPLHIRGSAHRHLPASPPAQIDHRSAALFGYAVWPAPRAASGIFPRRCLCGSNRQLAAATVVRNSPVQPVDQRKCATTRREGTVTTHRVRTSK